MVTIDIHALPGEQSLRDPESFTQIPRLKNEKPQMTQIGTEEGARRSTRVHCKSQSIPIQGQDVRVDYKGKVAGDEIRFTRTVDGSIKEEMVAKRVKESNAK